MFCLQVQQGLPLWDLAVLSSSTAKTLGRNKSAVSVVEDLLDFYMMRADVVKPSSETDQENTCIKYDNQRVKFYTQYFKVTIRNSMVINEQGT